MRLRLLIALPLLFTAPQVHARPVVLELFTSQGCDSCPPADKLLTKLAEDPKILALSYHVDYWDYIGWKDAFSLKDSTQRQYWYAKFAHKTQVFTPQLMVDGQQAVIGSRESEVHEAIDKAQVHPIDVPLTLTKQDKGLALVIGMLQGAPSPAQIVAVDFRHKAETQVKAGENKGRALSTVNAVTAIRPLGNWDGKALSLSLSTPPAAGDGIAILLQDEQTGRILGAASYISQ